MTLVKITNGNIKNTLKPPRGLTTSIFNQYSTNYAFRIRKLHYWNLKRIGSLINKQSECVLYKKHWYTTNTVKTGTFKITTVLIIVVFYCSIVNCGIRYVKRKVRFDRRLAVDWPVGGVAEMGRGTPPALASWDASCNIF